MKFFVFLIIVGLVFSVLPQDGFAHRDGCHTWHSCPSDSGSYTCGDKGHCSECPDNQYCKAGKPVSYESKIYPKPTDKVQVKKETTPKKTEPIILKKQVPMTKINTDICTGKTMCISGKVKSVVDGDTLHVDTYKVRLSLVNSPERGQAGFSEATAFTKKMCKIGSAVIVDQDDKQPFDIFGRLVGKVYCSDKNLNSELLVNGHASVLKKYCTKSEFGSEGWVKKYGC
jgi:endonuclease YncB( thermonuclease family)